MVSLANDILGVRLAKGSSSGGEEREAVITDIDSKKLTDTEMEARRAEDASNVVPVTVLTCHKRLMGA
jgi:hypothetical protein